MKNKEPKNTGVEEKIIRVEKRPEEYYAEAIKKAVQYNPIIENLLEERNLMRGEY